MRIRIVAAPPGQAPDWVREAWVGVVLRVIDDNALGRQEGVQGGVAQNRGGYAVSGREAVDELEKLDRAAALWWRQNAPQVLRNRLIFAREACQEC